MDLLQERPQEANISHRELPIWCDHVRFVESHPYEAWYFIRNYWRDVGAIYLSRQNEIGISIFKAHQGNGYGPQAINALMAIHGPRRYLANINPANVKSAEMFKNLGFGLIQHTYELRNEGLPSRS